MKRQAIFLLIFFLLFKTENVFSHSTNLLLSIKNDSLIAHYTEQVNKDSIESYIFMLQNLGTRFMITPNRKEVAEIIQNKFFTLGVEMVRIDSFQCTTQIDLWNLHYDTTTWQYNVIATIPGAINSNEYYVMGAHYDDVVAPSGDPLIFAPGADDNASGVAAMFEVARIIQTNGYIPLHNIELVAFAAEELMYYGNSGSEKYVEQSVANGMNILLMINNDMIAYTNEQPWQIRISNYIGSENLTWVSEYVTETFTDISPVLLAPSAEGSADCMYFVEAGVPSVYFFEKLFNPYYHTEFDLLENCNVGYCSEAIKISLGVLIGIDDPTVDLPEMQISPNLKIYPNPVSDYLNIKYLGKNEKSTFSYYIFDNVGKKILSGSFKETVVHRIDVSQLSSGIYSLQLIAEDRYCNYKIIVK